MAVTASSVTTHQLFFSPMEKIRKEGRKEGKKEGRKLPIRLFKILPYCYFYNIVF